jgi:hypothetical protein
MIAIQLTLDGARNAPIYAEYDLLTKVTSERIYVFQSGTGFDRDAKQLEKPPFAKYMNVYPNFRGGGVEDH